MRDTASHLDDVGRVVDGLTHLGLQPVLVGGMAMVTIGSRRVTRDFDFVIAHPEDRVQALVVLRVASEADLLRLKKTPRAGRSTPGDAEDIAFLEARQKAT